MPFVHRSEKLKERQEIILFTLAMKSGQKGTIRQMADEISGSVNGVSQSLRALEGRHYVRRLGGQGGEAEWEVTASGMDYVAEWL